MLRIFKIRITTECYLKTVQMSSVKHVNFFEKFKNHIIYQFSFFHLGKVYLLLNVC